MRRKRHGRSLRRRYGRAITLSGLERKLKGIVRSIKRVRV